MVLKYGMWLLHYYMRRGAASMAPKTCPKYDGGVRRLDTLYLMYSDFLVM